MPQICIDDKKAETISNSSTKLGEFIESVLASLPPDRIVTEIFLDGKRLSGWEGNSLLETDVQLVEDLQIRTASKRMWAADGLENAFNSIQRLQQSLLKATEYYHDNDLRSARKFLTRCLDGLERFLETMSITKSVLGIDFRCVDIDGVSLRQIELDLMKMLPALKNHDAVQDFQFIAEKVEYEVLPNLHVWNHALKKLRENSCD